MVGFALLQTLFEDYWTLAVSACSPTARPDNSKINATDCAKCNADLPTQNFSEVAAAASGSNLAVELRLNDAVWTGLCVNASCPAGIACWPLHMGPCDQLADADRLFIRGTDGSLTTKNGHVLDFGKYCPHCETQVGLSTSKILIQGKLAVWQTWSNNSGTIDQRGAPPKFRHQHPQFVTYLGGSTGRISTHAQSGQQCCLEATDLQFPGGGSSCPDAIHAACPGLTGPTCISCVEKHASALTGSCRDLDSQMHGVCGALATAAHRNSQERSWAANSTHESAVCNVTASLVSEFIFDLDTFVGAHEMFLLGTWLANSKLGAADAADAANLEYGARNLLTLWGGDEGSDLAGYDGKIWAGLLRDHYAPIWEMLLDEMRSSKATGRPIDSTLNHRQFQFSSDWVRQTNHYSTEPNGSVSDAAQAVVAKYCPTSAQVASHFTRKANTSVAGFTIPLARPLLDTDVGVLAALCKAHTECVGFTSKGDLKTNVAEQVAASGVDLFVSI